MDVSSAILSSSAASAAARAKADATPRPVKAPSPSAASEENSDDDIDILSFLWSEMCFFLVAVFLSYMLVVPNLSLRDLVMQNNFFLSVYLPIRVGVGAALHFVRAALTSMANGGLLEDISVVATVATSYLIIYHVLPAVGGDMTNLVKSALGKKAASLLKKAFLLADQEFSHIIYFASLIMLVLCIGRIGQGALRCFCARRS
jgi:hypothetical protein